MKKILLLTVLALANYILINYLFLCIDKIIINNLQTPFLAIAIILFIITFVAIMKMLELLNIIKLD